jgi:hypothetical protein
MIGSPNLSRDPERIKRNEFASTGINFEVKPL